MIKDIKTQDDFRQIQKLTFNLKEDVSENPGFLKEVFPDGLEEEEESQSFQAYTKFQTAYIEKCKCLGVLPLPIVKRIKYETLVLDNYQISLPIAKAFGSKMHLLQEYLKGIKLINNNMKDKEISHIISGMMFNPIDSLTIENNKCGDYSINSICSLIEINENN